MKLLSDLSIQVGIGGFWFANAIFYYHHTTASECKIDYKSVSEAYKRFWATCEDAYVFNVGEKVEFDITKLIPAPPTYNIQS